MKQIKALTYDTVLRDNYAPFMLETRREFREAVLMRMEQAELTANLFLRDALPTTKVFAFDRSLVEEVMDADIAEVTASDLRLPFNNFYIDFGGVVDCPVMGTTEKSVGLHICLRDFDRFAKIAKRWLPNVVVDYRLPREDVSLTAHTLVMCLWSHYSGNLHSPIPFDRWVMSYHSEPVTDKPYSWFGDDEKAVFKLATKFCAFLSSTNVTYDVVDRPSIKHKKGRVTERISLPKVHVIRFIKNYSVSLGSDEHTGRTVGVRHWVRGHYNKFRRGRIYECAVADGKIKADQAALVWIPRHQRGPEAGEQVASRYFVERGRVN